MSATKFKGTPIETKGSFPSVGQDAPPFNLVTTKLADFSLEDVKGSRVIFNIYPSVDTGICALQTKTFSKRFSDLENTTLVFASLDLPFAFSRFCAAENIDNAITASDFRTHSLEKYGVKMENGPLAGLYARAVIVLDENHKIIYSELVEEVTSEPNYDAAFAALA